MQARVLVIVLLRLHLQAGQRASSHRPHCQSKRPPCPRPSVPQSQTKAMEMRTHDGGARALSPEDHESHGEGQGKIKISVAPAAPSGGVAAKLAPAPDAAYDISTVTVMLVMIYYKRKRTHAFTRAAPAAARAYTMRATLLTRNNSSANRRFCPMNGCCCIQPRVTMLLQCVMWSQ